jgi:hypothetical protein
LQDARRNAESGDQSKEVTPAAKPGKVRRRWKGKNSLRKEGERQIWTSFPTATAMSSPSGLKRTAEGGFFEGDAVEDGAAAEVGVERAALFVGGEEEVPGGGGGEAGDVGGGLEGEGEGGGGGEVGGGDAVTDRGEEHGGVPGEDGVAAAVRRPQEVLEAVVHGGRGETGLGARVLGEEQEEDV